jgi:hypothetical protein
MEEFKSSVSFCCVVVQRLGKFRQGFSSGSKYKHNKDNVMQNPINDTLILPSDKTAARIPQCMERLVGFPQAASKRERREGPKVDS